MKAKKCLSLFVIFLLGVISSSALGNEGTNGNVAAKRAEDAHPGHDEFMRAKRIVVGSVRMLEIENADGLLGKEIDYVPHFHVEETLFAAPSHRDFHKVLSLGLYRTSRDLEKDAEQGEKVLLALGHDDHVLFYGLADKSTRAAAEAAIEQRKAKLASDLRKLEEQKPENHPYFAKMQESQGIAAVKGFTSGHTVQLGPDLVLRTFHTPKGIVYITEQRDIRGELRRRRPRGLRMPGGMKRPDPHEVVILLYSIKGDEQVIDELIEENEVTLRVLSAALDIPLKKTRELVEGPDKRVAQGFVPVE